MDLETSKAVSPKLPQAPSADPIRLPDSELSNVAEIAAHDRHTLIQSEESGVQLDLGELWHYRELLYFLTLRDIKVRYKQTVMGLAWVIIQPLGTMLIFTLVFNRFVRLDAGALPYPLFALSGLLLWLFFANAVTNSTHSLVSNTNLITKVYFPRMFIPAASVGAGLVDLAVAFLLFLLFESVADMNSVDSAPKPTANTTIATISSIRVKPDPPLCFRGNSRLAFCIWSSVTD